MSFLIPQALWALPVAALPLILHLMSQINTRTVQFSALRFLKEMEHESIRRLRWRQWLMIIIRTLMILMLILLLARPVMEGYYQGLVGRGATTLSLVLVDDSFSLSGLESDSGRRGRSEGQLTALFELLSGQGDLAQVVVIRTSDGRIVYDGDASGLPSVRELSVLLASRFEPDYLEAVYDSLSGATFQDRARLYANRELIIVSDFQVHQQDILRQWAADTTVWDDWQLLLMPIEMLQRNAAITRAVITTEIPIVGEVMNVAVTVSNSGKSALEDLSVQVVLNGVRAGQLVLSLAAGEEKNVRFQVIPTRPGFQDGYAEIGPDGRTGDNRFYFAAHIPTHIRILLLDNLAQLPAYGYLALSALEAASPQIELQRLPFGDVNWSSADFDVVILNGPLSVPRLLPRRLRELLEAGGHLVLLPGPSPNSAQAFMQIQQDLGLSVAAREPDIYSSPLGLDERRTRNSFMARAFSPEARRAQGPTVQSLYPIVPRAKDDVILRLKNRRPLLIRTPSLGGHVFTFSLPLDLRWTDLPLKGSYLPMWHRLISWQPSRGSLSDMRIGESRELPVSPRQATQPVLLEGPGNVSSRLIPDLQRRIVLLRDMHEPGIYTARFGAHDGGITGIEERFPVNISRTELAAGQLSTADLRALTGEQRAFIFEPGDDVAHWVSQARFGRELWRGLLYTLLLLILAELILANAYSTPRRPT